MILLAWPLAYPIGILDMAFDELTLVASQALVSRKKRPRMYDASTAGV